MEKLSELFNKIKSFFKREKELERASVQEERDVFANTRRNAPVLHEDTAAGETRLFSALDEIPQPQQQETPDEPDQLLVERDKPKPFVLSILFTSTKMLLAVIVLIGFACLGGLIGIAKAYIETTPTLDRAQLTKSDRTSYLYDMNGKLITSIADLEYRDWVDIENVPDMLKNAFVAVEDVRFYRHEGIDIKRLVKAAIEVLGNSNASGGSTITQQLIKNKVLSADRTYKRKIQEAYLAIELEQEITKEDILEAYLNDINLGESNYGVKTAAKDYFGKELSELTVRECAMLAGLTQNPSRYNPRKNRYERNGEESWKITNTRTDAVLDKMYKAGFITLEEYQQAKAEEVHINRVSEQKQMYDMPHFVEYAVRDVVLHLLEQRGLPDTNENYSAIENELRTGGYHIYTTVDPKIQNTVQTTLENWDEYPTLADPSAAIKTEKLADGSLLETIQPQVAAVIMDYHTGELRAVIGSRTTPTIRKSWNRAYRSYMEVGSSIKPLAVYGPALDAGASAATIIANLPAPIEGWNTEKGYPGIGSQRWIGPVSLRRGIVSSLNVVAARTLYEYVTPEVSAQYLINLGANASKIQADGPGLALGTSGMTPVQMAAAYSAIAAGGEYKEPLAFTRVVDGSGKIVLDAEQIREKKQIYKPSTAWLLVDILENAVKSGTGTKAKIDNMTVAGKTGTNSDYKSVYFAGMTPYYVGTVWIGHDDANLYKLKSGSDGGTFAAPLWQAFMAEIHKDLANKSIQQHTPDELGLVKRTVCSVSGKLATEACKMDTDEHLPISDWFLQENVPSEFCDMHAAVTLCAVSGQVATEHCPAGEAASGAVVLIRPGTYYDQFTDEEIAAGFSNAVRTPLTTEEYLSYVTGGSSSCIIHGWQSGSSLQSGTAQLSSQAAEMLTIAKNLMNHVEHEQAYALSGVITHLEEAMASGSFMALSDAVSTARSTIQQISEGQNAAG